MNKSVIGFLFLVGLVMFFVIGCGGNPEEAFVGTWVSVEHHVGGERSQELEGMTIEFKEDGTATTYMGQGNYIVEEDTIIFTSERGDEVRYEFQDDQLIVDTFLVKIIYEKVD